GLVRDPDVVTARWLMVRLTPTGLPDERFGPGGITIGDVMAVGPNATMQVVETRQGGRIIAREVEQISRPGRPPIGRPTLPRLLLDGTADAAFGQDGVARLSVEVACCSQWPVAAVLSDDSLLLQIAADRGDGTGTPTFARVDPAGNPDRTFGANGQFTRTIP